MDYANISPMTAAARQKRSRAPNGDEARWAAALARDGSCDGMFVMAVLTTGIYCRPSCPARKPLRKNVRFYATNAQAEAAGFRPCKRCRPQTVAQSDPNADRIIAACRRIEGDEVAPKLAELAAEAGMSTFHFHRVFKAATGVTPKAYAMAHRNRRLRDTLQEEATVTDAIYGSGFGSSGRFYEGARDALGMAPRTYRAGGHGMRIHYATAPCSLGEVLVAATDKGICAIFFGDTESTLAKELAQRFPHAELVGTDERLSAMLAQVVAHIEAPKSKIDLPLDVRGTAFQHQVWAALRELAPGEMATYGDIARRIGKPAAVRAVGAACGANPVAVVIPCHRVVGRDGKLTGYRWGVVRKRKLLDRERS